MNKRPTTYIDWKRLWHSESKYLGWHIYTNFQLAGHLIMDKETWKLLQRIKRIRDRLRIESEVKDITWYEDLLRALQQKGYK